MAEPKPDISPVAVQSGAARDPDDLAEVKELKSAMSAGRIPLASTYEQLIDMAAAGATAVGRLPEGAGPGPGLKLEEGRLGVSLGDGLRFNGNKVEVNVAPAQFGFSNGQLQLKAGPGLTVGAGAEVLAVKVDVNGGLAATSEGLALKLDELGGLEVKQSSLAVKVAPANGLKLSAQGVKANYDGVVNCGPGNGLDISQGTLSLLTNNASFHIDSSNHLSLRLTSSHLVFSDAITRPAVVARNFLRTIGGLISGLSCYFSGDFMIMGSGALGLKNALPTGTIVMYSGDAIPRNWALCDGTGETPDLRERFVDDTLSMSAEGSKRYRQVYIQLVGDFKK